MTEYKRGKPIPETSVMSKYDFSKGAAIRTVGKEEGLGDTKVVVVYEHSKTQSGISWEWPEDLLPMTEENLSLISEIQKAEEQERRWGNKARKLRDKLTVYTRKQFEELQNGISNPAPE